jgi:hypothetical protein
MKTRLILLTFTLGSWLFVDVLSATEYAYALASRGCMSNDALALEVYLTQKPYNGGAPPNPYIRMEIEWSDWENWVGKDLIFVQFSKRGRDPRMPLVRAELNLEGREQVWLRGTLRLKKVEVNKQVEGSYEFTGPNNLKLTGAFKAQWGKDGLPCG